VVDRHHAANRAPAAAICWNFPLYTLAFSLKKLNIVEKSIKTPFWGRNSKK
jgi:hypothetical protein